MFTFTWSSCFQKSKRQYNRREWNLSMLYASIDNDQFNVSVRLLAPWDLGSGHWFGACVYKNAIIIMIGPIFSLYFRWGSYNKKATSNIGKLWLWFLCHLCRFDPFGQLQSHYPCAVWPLVNPKCPRCFPQANDQKDNP